MKKFILYVLISFGSITSLIAQSPNSVIQIWLRDNKLLTVVLDERHYERYGRTITYVDVPAGLHEIKVYRFYPSDDDPRYDNSVKSTSKAQLVYKGKIKIDPKTMYYCTVDPQYNTMSIKESRNIAFDNRDRTFRIEENVEFRDKIDQNSNIKYENSIEPNAEVANDKLLTNNQLQSLNNAVQEKISSIDKVKLIEQFLANKTMKTYQVKEIIEWLSFENYKLRIAKYCFPKVEDQDKYLEVSSLLMYSNSKKELDDFIYDPKSTKPKLPALDLNQSKTIDQAQLQILEQKVKNKVTDTEKQKLMEESLGKNKMTTNQLMTMLDWLTFEGTRLEFVQWSYPRIIDKETIVQLKSKFSFLSSKKAIDALIGKK